MDIPHICAGKWGTRCSRQSKIQDAENCDCANGKNEVEFNHGNWKYSVSEY